MMEKYYISKGITKKGPYTLEQLKSQRINAKTLVWKESLPDWVTASELTELKPIIEIHPPKRIKSLDHFLDESTTERINYIVIVMSGLFSYLFCSLVLFDGYNALSMKSEIKAEGSESNNYIFRQREVMEEFPESLFVYKHSYGSSYREDPVIDILPTLDAVILNAFAGFITILITALTCLFAYQLPSIRAFGRYIQQFPDLLD